MRIPVLVNGLPGKMATETARAVVESSDFCLFPYALTGNKIDSRNGGRNFYIGDERVKLYGPNDLPNLEQAFAGRFAVDYTVPEAGAPNAEFYARNRMPFVMGTTSVDMVKIKETVAKRETSAVVSPNMALPIVAFQRFAHKYAIANANALNGCRFELKESHQAGKKDTSGTAKAMVENFNKLGIDFKIDQILKIRDREGSRNFGVPEEFLDAHGYHTYTIMDEKNSQRLSELYYSLEDFIHTPLMFRGSQVGEIATVTSRRVASPQTGFVFEVSYLSNAGNGESKLEIKHNVNGRKIYARGTLDALCFLQAAEFMESSQGKVFNMIDVLDWMERSRAA